MTLPQDAKELWLIHTTREWLELSGFRVQIRRKQDYDRIF